MYNCYFVPKRFDAHNENVKRRVTRCLLFEAKLPKSWWPHALQTSAYIRNRCYNPRLDMTAYEAVTGLRPNLQTMHIFGTICYAYVQVQSNFL